MWPIAIEELLRAYCARDDGPHRRRGRRGRGLPDAGRRPRAAAVPRRQPRPGAVRPARRGHPRSAGEPARRVRLGHPPVRRLEPRPASSCGPPCRHGWSGSPSSSSSIPPPSPGPAARSTDHASARCSSTSVSAPAEVVPMVDRRVQRTAPRCDGRSSSWSWSRATAPSPATTSRPGRRHRATFYKHYANKEELLADVAEGFAADVTAAFGDQPEGASRMVPLFEEARRSKDIARVILDGEGNGVALRRFAGIVEQILRDDLATGRTARRFADVDQDLLVKLRAAQVLAAVSWFIDHDEADAESPLVPCTACSSRDGAPDRVRTVRAPVAPVTFVAAGPSAWRGRPRRPRCRRRTPRR